MFKQFRFSQKTQTALTVFAVGVFIGLMFVPLSAAQTTCSPPFCTTTTNQYPTSTTTTGAVAPVGAQGAAFTVTWGDLAIIGIVGFVIGLVGTVVVMLAKRAYGIWVMIIREVGYSYKVVYQHKYSGVTKEFRKFNRTYGIDLSRTAWLDWANRPVLVYELETVTPVRVENTKKRLAQVLKSMKIEFSKKGMRPSDPFDLLFGRKLIEALFASARRKTKTSGAVIGMFVVIIVLVGIMAYLLGNLFPVVHIAQGAASNSTTVTHTTGTLGGQAVG